MRFLLAFFCLLTVSFSAMAQPGIRMTGDGLNLTNTATASGQIRQVDGVHGFDTYRKQLLGSPYEDSTFQAGNIRFYKPLPGSNSDSIMNVPIRYELQAHQLEILAGPNSIKVARTPQVRQFTISNKALNTISYYVNVREFRGETEQLDGFFDVITTGKAMLLRYPLVTVSKGNYNVALSVGSKDDELVVKQEWYAAVNKKVVAFTPGKRAVLALFPEKEAEMTAFLKQKKPDLKTRSGLASVFDYYNSL
ncbi:hypothetical protein [uncultured Fibrella sp.]|uniref:hypothetical protein n=1 Tax=uncultured Fibrella sp. TaxID=1284596 RepID=UPI0035CBD72E